MSDETRLKFSVKRIEQQGDCVTINFEVQNSLSPERGRAGLVREQFQVVFEDDGTSLMPRAVSALVDEAIQLLQLHCSALEKKLQNRIR